MVSADALRSDASDRSALRQALVVALIWVTADAGFTLRGVGPIRPTQPAVPSVGRISRRRIRPHQAWPHPPSPPDKTPTAINRTPKSVTQVTPPHLCSQSPTKPTHNLVFPTPRYPWRIHITGKRKETHPARNGKGTSGRMPTGRALTRRHRKPLKREGESGSAARLHSSGRANARSVASGIRPSPSRASAPRWPLSYMNSPSRSA